jgi:hypothetical protein
MGSTMSGRGGMIARRSIATSATGWCTSPFSPRRSGKFNDRHGRVGHVFQGRFGNELILDDQQFWTTARYIARNPVEAGLCRRAHEWKWSSHRGVLEATAPEWVDRGRLLERFATMGGEPERVYREAVDG